jgi:hypothetical protein
MHAIRYLAAGLLLAAATAVVFAQSPSQALPAQEYVVEHSDRGFTFTVTASGTHDSASGWSTVLESSIRYDFNRVFGMEVGVPYYMSHSGFNASPVTSINTNPPLVDSYNALGDAYMILHFAAPGTWFNYRSRIVGGFPSGDTSSGISTGRATFDFNNHFDHTWNFFTPYAELGIGDSSSLITRLVKQPYTTLGPVSHFKAGAGFSWKVFYVEGTAYENLPIGDQKVYARVITIRTLKKQKITTTRIVDTGQGLLEDNGVGAGLAVRLSHNLTLGMAYQYSVRESFDSAVIAVSYRFGKRKRKSDLLTTLENLPD